MGVYAFLDRKRKEWEDRLFLYQKRAFFDWVKEKGIEKDGCVIVHLFGESEVYQLREEKWERGSASKVDSHKQLRFILCGKGGLEKMSNLSGKKEWGNIFSSQHIEVWERSAYYTEKGLCLPLRLGMSQEEKKLVLEEVRRMIEDVLLGKEPHISKDFPSRFDDKQDLDVALWVNGKIRASVIMLGESCKKALERGAWRANKDLRFSPITLKELPETRIEITFMSDLTVPLFWDEYFRNDIDPRKGYMVSGEGKQGWYLPEVHNAVSFSDLKSFLARLRQEKARIEKEVPLAQYRQFEVIDWIESQNEILELTGPTPSLKNETSREEMKNMADRAVEWVCALQREDGIIPHVISEKGEIKRESLIVMTCTAHAFALYAKVTEDPVLLERTRKMYEYLRDSLDKDGEKPSASFFLVRAYFFRLTMALGEEVSKEDIKIVLQGKSLFKDNPIYWLQTLSLLVDYTKQGDRLYLEILTQEARKAYSVFAKKRGYPATQLAYYPEIISVLYELSQITKENKWREYAKEASWWYTNQQKEDGSFPHSPRRDFVYTRGTSKIFEVLTCFPEENSKALQKVLCWIQGTQYTEENLLWVEGKKKQYLVGGFRHDAFNREAWVDAAAHVVLGVSRLLEKNKSKE